MPKILVVVISLALLSSAIAYAQTRVRVTQEGAIIWTLGFPTVAAVLPVGTELQVVTRRGGFYEVVLPTPKAASGPTGLIAVGQVELVAGAPSSPESSDPPEVPAQPSTRPPAARAQAQSRSVAPALRGFGQMGYGRFEAEQSFAAIFDQTRGVWFGGGAQIHFSNGAFLQGSVDRFQRTGERVFLFDGQVFSLGVPNTLTLTPVSVTIGQYFASRPVLPYVGGGVGRYFLEEQAKAFSEETRVRDQFTSYHMLGGVEWQVGLIGLAGEVQYTHVPDSLDGGAAAAFGEKNIGGLQFRTKVLIGR